MRIRYLLLVLFGVLALAPVAIFGLWSSSNILRNEFNSVEDKHLLLARNLGAAMERYHSDVVSVFELLSQNLVDGHLLGNENVLLGNLEIVSLCIADAQNGGVVASAIVTGSGCPVLFGPEQLAVFRQRAGLDGGVKFTEVMAGENAGKNVMYVVKRIDDKLAIGAISTAYFVELGKAISFGIKGHAAIVDHKGNVLAHPLADWVAARKNIAGVSIVQRMFKGETGIEQFHSPALKGDMIAGFTTVPGTGWGVMIPQPVEELYQKAATAQSTAFAILISSLAIAAGVSLFISIRLSEPVERVIDAIERPGEGGHLEEIKVDRAMLIPQELVKLQETYNAMVGVMHHSQSRIRRLAYTDSVTALPNREAFQLLVTQQIEYLAETGGSGAMIFVDIDEFKLINDTLGHDRGDQVLRALADRLSFAVHQIMGVKPVDRNPEENTPAAKLVEAPIIGRMGGDEFTVFIPRPPSRLRLERILKQIRDELARPLPDFGGANMGEISGSASIGAACFPKHGQDYDTLVKLADLAMYHAKRNGKNCYQIFRPEIGDVTSAEMRIDVARGLKIDEFILHYQPKINSKTGAVSGVEALIRWEHPERDLLQPSAFIPLVEESDVIIELGEWALRKAAEQIVRWDEEGLELGVAVNIASRHFGSKGFAKRARDIVLRAGVDPSRIELEITEETVLTSMEYAQAIIEDLQVSGFHISLDDFGRGYSNLTRLANLEVNTIKIDGPLTAGVTSDERTRVIVASTIEMARGLGCATVAEGVETLEQASMLRKLGCDDLQGFYFARPMEGKVLATWLSDRRPNAVRDMQGRLAKAKLRG